MAPSSVRFLSEEFLKNYENIQPKNKGILFEVLFLRSYSRYLPDKNRRETWLETVQRVTEYSLSLYQGPASYLDLVKEAELMFDKVFHLEVLPSGRSLWIGGTEAIKKNQEAAFNCCALVITKLEDFCDIFHLLMCGCGVGYRVLKKDVINLPLLNTNFYSYHKEYEPKHPIERLEMTESFSTIDDNIEVFSIYIGDSKQAWVEALRLFLNKLTNTSKKIVFDFNYDSIRPAGERIKTAGGIAPGPFGMKEMFIQLERIIKEAEGTFSPVTAMDIANILAKNVIVGGTRRSAQIALGDPSDQEFIEAKKDLYKYEDGKWKVNELKEHRTMSNNSVTYTYKPSKEEIGNIFKNIRYNGEPGFFNLVAASKRRPNANTANPCNEIILDSYGVCNLSTVVLSSHLINNEVDLNRLQESIALATRIGLRQTNVTLSLSHWDEVQKRDRLTGVSMTGLVDTLDKLGWTSTEARARDLLSKMRKFANQEADKYSFEMRIPRPLLVTCCKPEGSLSLLPTVSPGLHRSYAPYYIRRIRVSELDPVCKALQKLGVPNERDITKKNSTRIVFSFPIKSGAIIKANDESAKDQFDRYLIMQNYYTDHNSSCTLTVGDNEWNDIVESVDRNWESVVGCAFLPKDSRSYPQMPLESITEEQYIEMVKSFPNLSSLANLVNQYENGFDEEPELIDCSSGSCPVR